MSTAVLIVNYKAYDDLTCCLASLSPHLQPDDEVEVVDYEATPRPWPLPSQATPSKACRVPTTWASPPA